MADAQGDTLMFFVLTEGSQPIAAESTSSLAGQDARLMKGFVQGRFFEVESFSLGVDLADDEGKSGGGEGGRYARWRALKSTDPKPKPPFQAEPRDVTITRRIDAFSPLLLQNCLQTKRFDKAVLVKRSRIGTSNMLSAILRLEFRQVWIRTVEWQDGDTVRETCKFKYAAVKAIYFKRKPDGSVDSPWPCQWVSMAVDEANFDV